MSFTKKYFKESIAIIGQINQSDVENLASGLGVVKVNKGRLFILGVGGSAGTASHAVNDFRKICGIETYTPVDNVSELTARVNDDGWDTCYSEWLKGSNIKTGDGVLILSVGGGSVEKNVSVNLIKSIEVAKQHGAWVFGIVGKDGGYTKQNADCTVVIPVLNSDRITPHTEGLCSVILHLLVSHPKIKVAQTKWESVV